MSERERAIEKARKVLTLGVSTTYVGEKEACLQRLITLLRTHDLLLSHLDPRFPRRMDELVLRQKLGLLPEPPDQAAGSGQGATPRSSSSAAGPGRPQVDPETILFLPMTAAERRKWLRGPVFSQGLLRVVRDTSAYPRLLADARALDRSNLGVGLSDQDLMGWLDRVLSRQGSRVDCKPRSSTIFDDLMTYCRAAFTADTRDLRQAAQQRRAQEEARAREHQAQERRRRQDQERQARQQQEEARRAAQAHDWHDVEVEFDDLTEARLYLKVVRRLSNDSNRVASAARDRKYVVRFSGPGRLERRVDQTYARALAELQQAAEQLRLEAAHRRNEAIRQAEAEYEAACARAFQVTVEHY
ncbi:hypothetical protein [Deinococcus hohokamensis]|uniref:Uncharacterized protein n=1 Tax=Deinococcus hohokamensis TaxID=309883 RepID=A0ABV9I948_9DEIO